MCYLVDDGPVEGEREELVLGGRDGVDEALDLLALLLGRGRLLVVARPRLVLVVVQRDQLALLALTHVVVVLETKQYKVHILQKLGL